MSLKRDWVRNAFAVNPQLEPPTAEQQQLVEDLSREVVRRGMTGPALAFLEMSRPLNYLGSQALQFFQPMVSAVFDTQRYEEFSRFLQRRDSIDFMCGMIDQVANEPKPLADDDRQV